MNKYYVYIYINPINNVPFYVGMGQGLRYKFHLKESSQNLKNRANVHKLNTIKKIMNCGLTPIVKFVDTNLSKEDAIDLEKFMISEIGRKDLNRGPLTNKTDGGDGIQNLSPEIRKKLSAMFSGYVTAKSTITGEKIRISVHDDRWISGEYVGITKGYTHKNINQYDRFGENNPAWGIKRGDVVQMNKDPILNTKRRESFKKNKLLKNCKDLGFDDVESATEYLSYISSLYFNFGYFNFLRFILKSIINQNGVDNEVSHYKLSQVLKSLNIDMPSNKVKIVYD
jgi:hypothetical protein